MASIVCPSCGIKVRAGRDRCPKCRQPLTAVTVAEPQPQQRAQPQPLIPARSKAFIPGVTAIGVAIAALAGFALWRAGDPTATIPIAAAPVAVAKTLAGPPTAASSDRSAPRLSAEQFIESAQAGRVAFSGGDYAAAIDLYEKAVTSRPQDAESWSNLGQTLVKMNRVEASIEKFERAIELNPDRWSYHFNLARAEGLLGNWDVAVREYQAAQQLFPGDYATAFNLGLALRKSGDDAGAVEAFKHAIEIDPQDPTFHFSLAGAYEKLGQVADAITEYQRTLELAGSAPEAPAIQARISRLKGEAPRPVTAPAGTPAKEAAPVSETGR